MESFFYFGSEQAPLFGALHLPPAKERGSLGAVLCPPLGHDNIATYRPLGVLASQLARHAACPTLRFDWPGIGDSAGCTDDPGLVRLWLEAVPRAVDELRRQTGVERVVLVGVGIGATLATVAAADAPLVSDMVLWAPHVSGRAYVRELRALEAFSRPSVEDAPDIHTQLPEGSFESAGFFFSAETTAALAAIDLLATDVSGSGLQRVLLIGPDKKMPDERLVAHFHPARVDVAQGRGLDMLVNDTTRVPRRAFADIRAWIVDRSQPPASRNGAHATTRHTFDATEFSEEIVVLNGRRGALVGVVTTPRERVDAGTPWVVFFTTGSVRRSGPHRMWTRLAREWAAAGIPSLRVDAWGVGDSYGPSTATATLSTIYADDVLGSHDAALSWLRETHAPVSVVAIGLCSGSTMAFQTALRHPEITRCLLVNLPTFAWIPAADEADMVLTTLRERGYLRTRWRRLRDDELELRRSLAAIGSVAAAKARDALRLNRPDVERIGAEVTAGIERICARGGQLLLVYAKDDAALIRLERRYPGGLARLTEHDGVQIETVPGAGHTFMPLWAQDHLAVRFTEALETGAPIGPEGNRGAERPNPSVGRDPSPSALEG